MKLATLSLSLALASAAALDAPDCPADDFFTGIDGLNATCYESSDSSTGYVMRIKSSGIPNHKYINPGGQVVEQDYDVEIPLNPTAESSRSYQDACNFQTVFKTGGQPEKPQNPQMFPVVGIALNGVALMSPLSIDSVDPFYPTGGKQPEKLDGCVGHPQGAGQYHYHTAPPCLYGSDAQGSTPLQELGDAKTIVMAGFDPKDGLQKIGWALDGFPVYGVYDDDGNEHTGLDNCNGKFDNNGDYAYYSTSHFPYHVGCFGPGTYDAPTPSCSGNVKVSLMAAANETDVDVIEGM